MAEEDAVILSAQPDQRRYDAFELFGEQQPIVGADRPGTARELSGWSRIYAVGRLELADLFPNEEPSMRQQMIEAKILLTYKRDLSNLSMQETRLRRHRQQDLAALQELQTERKKRVRDSLREAATLYIQAVHDGTHTSFDPAQFGFEFSLAEVELCAMDLCPDLFAEYERNLAEGLNNRKSAA